MGRPTLEIDQAKLGHPIGSSPHWTKRVGLAVSPIGAESLGSGGLPSLCWSGRMGWSSIPFGSGLDPPSTSRLEKGSNDDYDGCDEKKMMEKATLNVS